MYVLRCPKAAGNPQCQQTPKPLLAKALGQNVQNGEKSSLSYFCPKGASAETLACIGF